MQGEALVRTHTVVARPYLVPELELHLITPACPLWRAGEAELAQAGLPAPFWAFAWPGGQALARYLLDHPEEVRGRRVLDFGAGGAVEGLAALLAGAASVLAADIDPVACAAARLNAALNGLALETTAADLTDRPVEGFALILAGDVCYQRDEGRRFSAWLQACAQRGARVLLGDPHRGFLAAEGWRTVAELEAPSDVDVEGRYLKRTAIRALTPPAPARRE